MSAALSMKKEELLAVSVKMDMHQLKDIIEIITNNIELIENSETLLKLAKGISGSAIHELSRMYSLFAINTNR